MEFLGGTSPVWVGAFISGTEGGFSVGLFRRHEAGGPPARSHAQEFPTSDQRPPLVWFGFTSRAFKSLTYT